MNWTYSIAMEISGIGEVSAAERAVERLDDATERAGGAAAQAGQKYERMGKKGQNAFSVMRGAASRLLATLGIMSATLLSINNAAAFDAQNIAIDFATSGDGAENIEFVSNLTERLGLNLQASREGFKQLAASLRGTNMEGDATRRIFQGVASAGGAMRLSADQIQGAYLAISQIASKGKVQAEELRGQLGERIPGAFKIAADAMGVTQAELNKMLETGQVAAEDFLPKFADQLEKTFGADAARVADSPAASIERFKNSIYGLTIAIGNNLLPTVQTLVDNYFIPGVTFISEHIDLMQALAIGVGVAWAAFKLYGIYTAIAAINLKGMTVAQYALNLAMSANPVGLVVTALGALTAALVYAWNKSKGFRMFLLGMWETLKETGAILYDFLIAPLFSVGKALIGAFTLDKDMIAEAIADMGNVLERQAQGVGERVANAYGRGREKGLLSFAEDNPTESSATAAAAQNARMGGSPGSNPTAGADTGNSNQTQAGITGITGRSSSKNINISLNNLIGELQIISRNGNEGADEMEQVVTRKLLQVLNSANQVQ